jgi:predicted nucleic acid-binding protein
VKRIVVDASVALKWFLADEDNSQSALLLLDKYVSFELEIVSPTLLEYEVLNGLHIARKRGRLVQEKLILAIEGFVGLGIEQRSMSSIYPKVMHFSEAYSLSVYDASYLAVADEERIEFITADLVLFNRVKNGLKWMTWLGD